MSTTDKVKELLDLGYSKSEIAKILGIRPPSVTHHTKKLDEKYQQGRDETKDWPAIQAYYDEGHTMRECRDEFGFAMATWQKAVRRGSIKPRHEKTLIEDYLVLDSSISSSRLKKRIFEENLLENKCNECGQLPIWNNKPLVLQLDHVNGNPEDNRIENLRILCGHCHSQTDTFCKGHKDRRIKETFCGCGKKIGHKSLNCRKCSLKIVRTETRKVDRPSKEELEKLIWEIPTLQLAKRFGVSDKAVEKWCISYGISKPPRGYWAAKKASETKED